MSTKFVSMSLSESQSYVLHSPLLRPKRHKRNNSVKCQNSYDNDIHQPLSPDVQPTSPSFHGSEDTTIQNASVKRIGNYLILQKIETNLGPFPSYKAVNLFTQETYQCKVTPIASYREILGPYLRVGNHDNINEVQEVILGESEAYLFFLENYGDLHTYIRNARRLKESEAARLFAQIVSAVKHCHENGIVIRDLKLRKFVFKNRDRTKLMLEGFEDSIILSQSADDDEYSDMLTDKHGCPVYVSPEILQSTTHYSGCHADIWSLGVILYTMLFGCYPFHDTNINTLFLLIRHGHYSIPPTVSSAAKCLIKNILRMKPNERLSASEILCHPWFNQCETRSSRSWRSEMRGSEHVVPDRETCSNDDVIQF